MADLVTIFVPTKDRPDFLFRLLTYFARVKCAIPITIADSSSAATQQIIAGIVGGFEQALSITLLQFAPETGIGAKQMAGLSAVRTEFVVLCADDDFIVPGSVLKCAEFLKAHPDYNAAHGPAAAFRLVSPHTFHGPLESAEEYQQKAFESEDAAERLERHCARYSTNVYSVYRRAILLMTLTHASDLDVYFGELLPSFLAVVLGKVKRIDDFYMLRQAHKLSTSTSSACPTTLFDWIGSAAWNRNYLKVVELTSVALSAMRQISKAEARASVEKSIWLYIASSMAGDLDSKLVNRHAPDGRPCWAIDNPDPWLNSLPALISPDSPYSREVAPIIETIMQTERAALAPAVTS